MKRRILKIIFILLFVFTLGVVYSIFYSVTGKGIPCIFHMVTGFLCPGCGVTRMCISILQGNFLEAMKYNFMLFFLSPYIIYILIFDIVQYIKDGKCNHTKCQEVMIYLMIVLLIVFSIIRNIKIIFGL